MHKLTCPLSQPERIGASGPHRTRMLSGRLLVTDDDGGYDSLTPTEYRRFLTGVRMLKSRPAAAGNGSLLAWSGPPRHVVILSDDAGLMTLETLRQTMDFIFTTASSRLVVELVAVNVSEVWPQVWFAARYIRRKSQWACRPVSVVLRCSAQPSPKQADDLGAQQVHVRGVMELSGRPKPPVRFSSSLLALVGESAREPSAWVSAWLDAGLQSVRLKPSAVLSSPAARKRFHLFYARVLDRLIETVRLPEEWAAETFGRPRWEQSGLDILSELAYDPRGRVFSSEEASARSEEDASLCVLGTVGDLRYASLQKAPIVRASLASLMGENQPLCFQCAYVPYCALPPAGNLRLQGTLWGQTPSSPLCDTQMGSLDILFKRLRTDKARTVLEKWSRMEF